MKKINKKTIIILCVVVALLVIGTPVSVYGYRSYSYSKNYNEAVQLMNDDRFDEATAKFYKALDFSKKDNKSVKDKLDLINYLRVSKQYYEDASKLMGEKKYSEAIELFKKVSKEDENRFNDSQNKLDECRTIFVSINLTSARNLAKENKFEEAVKLLDAVLTFEKDNQEAAALKKVYDDTIQKQKADAEEKARKEAEEKARKEAEAAAAAKAREEAAKIITATVSDRKLVIKDNGRTLTFEFKEGHTGMYQQLSYYVEGSMVDGNLEIKLQNYYQSNYKIIFYGKDGAAYTADGITRDPREFSISGNNILDFVCYPGTKFDVFITYKDKEYKFSGVTQLSN